MDTQIILDHAKIITMRVELRYLRGDGSEMVWIAGRGWIVDRKYRGAGNVFRFYAGRSIRRKALKLSRIKGAAEE